MRVLSLADHQTPMAQATPESIASARQAQQQERQQVTQQKGITFAGDRMVPPRRAVAIACLMPGCLVTVAGGSEAEAFTRLESHLTRKHGVNAPRSVA